MEHFSCFMQRLHVLGAHPIEQKEYESSQLCFRGDSISTTMWGAMISLSPCIAPMVEKDWSPWTTRGQNCMIHHLIGEARWVSTNSYSKGRLPYTLRQARWTIQTTWYQSRTGLWMACDGMEPFRISSVPNIDSQTSSGMSTMDWNPWSQSLVDHRETSLPWTQEPVDHPKLQLALATTEWTCRLAGF